MKRYISIIAACVAAAFITGCENEVPVPEKADINLSEDIVAIPCEGTTYEVDIKTNYDWQAVVSDDVDWITVEPASGKAGKTTVTITVAGHLGHKSRMGGVFIVSENLRKQVSIAQAPAPNLDKITTSEELVSFEYEAASKSVSIVSNVDWTLSYDADWLSVTPTSGSASKDPVTLTVTVLRNSGKANRTCEVVISGGDAEDAVLNVFQEAFESIAASVHDVNFTAAGDSDNNVVTIEANVAWTATSSASWLTISPASGAKGEKVTMTLTAAPNKGEQRVATVKLTSPNSEEIINVLQEGYVRRKKTLATFKFNDAAYTDSHSPDWSTSGANAYSKGTGKGIALPEESGSDAYITWHHGEQWTETSSLPIVFITAAEGHLAVKPCGLDDGYEIHIPLTDVPSGSVATAIIGLRATDTAPRYYMAKYSIDNGATWTNADTGNSYTANNGAKANFDLKTKNVIISMKADMAIDKNISNGELLIRVVAVDKYTIKATNPSTPTSGATVRMTPATIDGVSYDGPVITLEY